MTIIYSGLNIQGSDLWIRCSPRQMCTNKLACLVKAVFFQERGSCETRKGLEKKKNVLGEGRRKTVPVFLCFVCSILFFVVVLASAASVVFFPEAFFRFLELAGKGNDCYAGLQQSSHDISPRLSITFTLFCSLAKGYLLNKLVKNCTVMMKRNHGFISKTCYCREVHAQSLETKRGLSASSLLAEALFLVFVDGRKETSAMGRK